MKKFLNEFKEFAMRGNVLDMAVGIIVGAAFTAIVTSLVDDILSPIIGLLVRVNFSDLVVTIAGVELRYGSFIMAVINFLIVAFVLFLLIKAMNTAANLGKNKKEEAPTTKTCPYCMSEIPTVLLSSLKLRQIKKKTLLKAVFRKLKAPDICGCSLVVKLQLPKLALRVRFSSSAPSSNHWNFNVPMVFVLSIWLSRCFIYALFPLKPLFL